MTLSATSAWSAALLAVLASACDPGTTDGDQGESSSADGPPAPPPPPVGPEVSPQGRRPAPSPEIAAGDADGAIAGTEDGSDPAVPSPLDRVYAPVVGPAPPPERVFEVLPASRPDDEWAAGPPVEARRLVYRVELHVPAGLGHPPPEVPTPLAELRLDVANERLRGEFAGTGWPLPPGSQVRLRADRGGVYVFDGDGGRPLRPGRLAEWFQGAPPRGFTPVIRLGRAGEQPLDGPGALVCAFLAELADEPREPTVRRCGRAGAPTRFRIGPWSALRTADVPVSLARSALRADHVDPPDGIPDLRAGLLLPRSARAALPGRGFRPGPGTLRLSNQGSSRLIATVDGAAVAWVDPGEELVVDGFDSGLHLLGGIRPLGNLAIPGRDLTLPGSLTLRR